MKQYLVTGILFVLVLSVIIFLFTQTENEKSSHIVKSIDIKGCKMLGKQDYLKFISMTIFPSKEKISLAIIKDRFLKHPYVENARIEIHYDKSLTVHLTEKEIIANVLVEGTMHFYSSKREILPHLKNTRIIDFPLVMSNDLSQASANKVFKSEKMENALELIISAKIFSKELYQKISQISSDENELRIALTDFDGEIIFSSEQIPANIIALGRMVEKFGMNQEFKTLYTKMDFRFDDHIFLTKKEVIGI